MYRRARVFLLALLPTLTGCIHDYFGPTYLRTDLSPDATHATVYAYSGGHRLSLIWDDRGEAVVPLCYYALEYRLPPDGGPPTYLRARAIRERDIPDREPAGSSSPDIRSLREALDSFHQAPLTRDCELYSGRRVGDVIHILVEGQYWLRYLKSYPLPGTPWLLLDSLGRRTTIPTPTPEGYYPEDFDAAHHRVLFSTRDGVSPLLLWDYADNTLTRYPFETEHDFAAYLPPAPRH